MSREYRDDHRSSDRGRERGGEERGRSDDRGRDRRDDSRGSDRGRGGDDGDRDRSRDAGPPQRVSLLIRNLPLECRVEEVRAKFERYGEIRDVYMPRDYYSQRSRGFGFIEFKDSKDAEDAMYALDRSMIGGREVSVVLSKESRKTPREMLKREDVYKSEPISKGRRSSRSRSRSPKRSSRSRGHTTSRSPPPRSRSPKRSASRSPPPRRSPPRRSPCRSRSPAH